MRISIGKALREAALVCVILAGGLVMGGLSPAYSQEDLAAAVAAGR